MTQTVSCFSCQPPTYHANYGKLAVHIMATKGHRKGRKWAAKYLMLHGKRNGHNNQGRIPLTEGQHEAKQSSRYQPSGKTEVVQTICPKCKRGQKLGLPVEFTESPTAWRIKDFFAVLCSVCGG